MKHAKKMVFVPEDEYLTLLRLIAGPSKVEEAETGSRIKKILDNPKLSETAKGHKYDLLFKKRRKLTKGITEVESKQGFEPLLAEELPTTGITPAEIKARQAQNLQKQVIAGVKPGLKKTVSLPVQAPIVAVPAPKAEEVEAPKKTPKKAAPKKKKAETPKEQEFAYFEGQQEPETTKKVSPVKTRSQTTYIVPEEKYDELYDYVQSNFRNLGIDQSGAILAIPNRESSKIEGSNYKDLLNIITGKQQPFDENQSKAVGTLVRRLKRNPKIEAIFNKQSGSGMKRKKYLIDLQSGSGIKRKKYLIDLREKKSNINKVKRLTKFTKPQLWMKLNV